MMRMRWWCPRGSKSLTCCSGRRGREKKLSVKLSQELMKFCWSKSCIKVCLIIISHNLFRTKLITNKTALHAGNMNVSEKIKVEMQVMWETQPRKEKEDKTWTVRPVNVLVTLTLFFTTKSTDTHFLWNSIVRQKQTLTQTRQEQDNNLSLVVLSPSSSSKTDLISSLFSTGFLTQLLLDLDL